MASSTRRSTGSVISMRVPCASSTFTLTCPSSACVVNSVGSVGKITAEKLNRAKGPTRVFIPLRGFSYPDRENLGHWEPEGNQAFIDALKAHLRPWIALQEIDAHINDPEFIDPLADAFLSMMDKYIIQ